MMRRLTVVAVVVLVLLNPTAVPVVTVAQSRPTPRACQSLASLTLPNTTITLSEAVPAGHFVLQSGTAQPNAFKALPSFCRVMATLKPTMQSDIRIEVWLPTSNWNGKFQAVGNGGFGGAITYVVPGPPGQAIDQARPSAVDRGMVAALQRGYATSSTDTGHTGGGSFALGHPEKVTDFAYRAVHEMTLTAKAVIEAFYGKAPSFSYWNGCSVGGGQGVMEAHRFPDDYDGIIAGSPGSPLSRGYAAWALWLAGATLKHPAGFIPPSKYAVIHEAVLRSCDASDGVKDGLIDNPRRCTFNPEGLLCKGTDNPACLTIAQVEAVKKLLSPATNPRTGTVIYPPLEPGSELEWAGVAGGPGPLAPAVDAFKYVFLKDLNWDWRTLDFDRDVSLADKIIELEKTNTLQPDIRAFAQRGAKLLLFHGWSDGLNAPQSTINYYNSLQSTLRNVATSNSVRLFMAPGMAHCGGGEGPNTFDGLAVLERWVERANAPEQIIASHSTDGKVDRTRKLCPYPQVARYNGTGSIDDHANFVCKDP